LLVSPLYSNQKPLEKEEENGSGFETGTAKPQEGKSYLCHVNLTHSIVRPEEEEEE